MYLENVKNFLTEEDFHLDPLGRMVIDNPEILSAINGAALTQPLFDDAYLNGACANSGCT